MTETQFQEEAAGQRWYRTVWRWHFYAGLFCIPFVLWLATTGSIYLFKPQIEALIDRPYDNLAVSGERATAAAQVRAALAAVPGANFRAYELPKTPESAIRVIVGRKRELTRVYVNPATLQVLKTVPEEDRLMRVIFKLHGELLWGDRGSLIVELAASWAVVMILTGLYLWWPRRAAGLAGILYPRLRQGGRVFWRDLHAVTGVWVSAFALFILLSGLPWAKSWGSYLKDVRQVTGMAVTHQDWSIGSTALVDEMGGMPDMPGMAMDRAPPPPAADYGAIDRMVATVAPLNLAYPVLISPPKKAGAEWTAKSDAQNRTLRTDLVLDGRTGAIVSRVDFDQRLPVDRVVAVGVAAHEGQLFGWPNQLISLLTAMGLVLMSISAVILWWRRRAVGVLGAPLAPRSRPRSLGFAAAIVGLCLLLPLLGISMIVVMILEKLVLERIPGVRRWLGLREGPVLARA
jgi:uncharacterized iron-regulated membrane protein